MWISLSYKTWKVTKYCSKLKMSEIQMRPKSFEILLSFQNVFQDTLHRDSMIVFFCALLSVIDVDRISITSDFGVYSF